MFTTVLLLVTLMYFYVDDIRLVYTAYDEWMIIHLTPIGFTATASQEIGIINIALMTYVFAAAVVYVTTQLRQLIVGLAIGGGLLGGIALLIIGGGRVIPLSPDGLPMWWFNFAGLAMLFTSIICALITFNVNIGGARRQPRWRKKTRYI